VSNNVKFATSVNAALPYVVIQLAKTQTNSRSSNGFSNNYNSILISFKFSLLLLSHYESKLELVF